MDRALGERVAAGNRLTSLNKTRALLDGGADPNVRLPHDQTVLHVAVSMATETGDLRHVKALLAAGADPTAVDDYGKLPMHYARNLPEVVAPLLAAQRAVELEALLPQVDQREPASRSEALQAAWASTQPTKDNLVAAQANQAPALTTGRRPRF